MELRAVQLPASCRPHGFVDTADRFHWKTMRLRVAACAKKPPLTTSKAPQ